MDYTVQYQCNGVWVSMRTKRENLGMARRIAAGVKGRVLDSKGKDVTREKPRVKRTATPQW